MYVIIVYVHVNACVCLICKVYISLWILHFFLNIVKLSDEYLSIMITCPCNEKTLTLHFYYSRLGSTGVYISFLFLLQNIDCRYSLECLTCTHNQYLSKNKKNTKNESKNEHFNSHEILLYIAWACLRNGVIA